MSTCAGPPCTLPARPHTSAGLTNKHGGNERNHGHSLTAHPKPCSENPIFRMPPSFDLCPVPSLPAELAHHSRACSPARSRCAMTTVAAVRKVEINQRINGHRSVLDSPRGRVGSSPRAGKDGQGDCNKNRQAGWVCVVVAGLRALAASSGLLHQALRLDKVDARMQGGDLRWAGAG